MRIKFVLHNPSTSAEERNGGRGGVGGGVGGSPTTITFEQTSKSAGYSLSGTYPSDAHAFIECYPEGSSWGPPNRIMYAILGSSQCPDLSEYERVVKTLDFAGHLYSVRGAIEASRYLKVCEKVRFFLGEKTQVAALFDQADLEELPPEVDPVLHVKQLSIHLKLDWVRKGDVVGRRMLDKQLSAVFRHALKFYPLLEDINITLPEEIHYYEEIKRHINGWKYLKFTCTAQLTSGKDGEAGAGINKVPKVPVVVSKIPVIERPLSSSTTSGFASSGGSSTLSSGSSSSFSSSSAGAGAATPSTSRNPIGSPQMDKSRERVVAPSPVPLTKGPSTKTTPMRKGLVPYTVAVDEETTDGEFETEQDPLSRPTTTAQKRNGFIESSASKRFRPKPRPPPPPLMPNPLPQRLTRPAKNLPQRPRREEAPTPIYENDVDMRGSRVGSIGEAPYRRLSDSPQPRRPHPSLDKEAGVLSDKTGIVYETYEEEMERMRMEGEKRKSAEEIDVKLNINGSNKVFEWSPNVRFAPEVFKGMYSRRSRTEGVVEGAVQKTSQGSTATAKLDVHRLFHQLKANNLV